MVCWASIQEPELSKVPLSVFLYVYTVGFAIELIDSAVIICGDMIYCVIQVRFGSGA